MNVTVFFDSSLSQSLLSAWFSKMTWDNVSLKDTKGLSEGDTDTLIATISATSQDRIYACVSVAAGHVAGNLTTAQVTTLNGKIKTTAVAPYNVVVEVGDVSGGLQPVIRMWNELYPTNTPPKLAQYLGTYKFPEVTGTADSVGAGSLTETGAFTDLDLSGHYVYVISGTTGAGEVMEIESNTDDVLTLVDNWDVTPSGTVIYGVVRAEEDALKEVYSDYYIKVYLNNLSDPTEFNKVCRLINYNLYVSPVSVNWENIPNGAMRQDLTYLDNCLILGKAMYDYSIL